MAALALTSLPRPLLDGHGVALGVRRRARFLDHCVHPLVYIFGRLILFHFLSWFVYAIFVIDDIILLVLVLICLLLFIALGLRLQTGQSLMVLVDRAHGHRRAGKRAHPRAHAVLRQQLVSLTYFHDLDWIDAEVILSRGDGRVLGLLSVIWTGFRLLCLCHLRGLNYGLAGGGGRTRYFLLHAFVRREGQPPEHNVDGGQLADVVRRVNLLEAGIWARRGEQLRLLTFWVGVFRLISSLLLLLLFNRRGNDFKLVVLIDQAEVRLRPLLLL